MYNQNHMINSIMSKIEINGTLEEIQRIAVFLENNYIKHSVVSNSKDARLLEELEETIEWPF